MNSKKPTIKHFLHNTSELTGRTIDGRNLGHHKAQHDVFCFAQGECLEGFPVVTSVRSGCFNSQSYYTSAEARVLARALIAAADHADEQEEAKRAAEYLRALSEASDTLSEVAP
jgi:hypothetical protein